MIEDGSNKVSTEQKITTTKNIYIFLKSLLYFGK